MGLMARIRDTPSQSRGVSGTSVTRRFEPVVATPTGSSSRRSPPPTRGRTSGTVRPTKVTVETRVLEMSPTRPSAGPPDGRTTVSAERLAVGPRSVPPTSSVRGPCQRQGVVESRTPTGRWTRVTVVPRL